MYDLHTHSSWSDGELIPAELVQRASANGYRGIAITDHADASNLNRIIEGLSRFEASIARGRSDIAVLTGVELTHNPPEQIPALIAEARRLGAGLVVVHGETLAEPVAKGTNHAAIIGEADILAHPGLLDPADARLAAKKGVRVEITARKGHNMSNGHVMLTCKKFGVPVVFDTDSHAPSDLFTPARLSFVARGAGYSLIELRRSQEISKKLIQERLKDRKRS